MKKLLFSAALVGVFGAAPPAIAGDLIIDGPKPSQLATSVQAVPAVPLGAPTSAVNGEGALTAVLPQRIWRVLVEDIRLSTTVERWSRDAGYRLIWDAKKQVLLSAADSSTGTFEEALKRALSSPAILKSEYPLEACFYPNTPPIVRITRQGEQTEECPL